MEGLTTLYLAYLDEFGHIGPFVSKDHPRYRTSPVFGLAGIVLPYDRVRDFATWFYKLKCNLLKFEIDGSETHPARWEKKGAALLTTRNVQQYPELRFAINRILNKIEGVGGFVFYYGMVKHHTPEESSSEQLYSAVLRHSIQKLNAQCIRDDAQFIMILDESDAKFHQEVINRKAALTMFGDDFCTRLVEPPFQVVSHLYQTLQCADWVCGLLGRIGAHYAEPIDFAEFEWAQRYFGNRLARVAKRSGIRSKQKAVELRARYAERVSRPFVAVTARLSERVLLSDGTVSQVSVDLRSSAASVLPIEPKRRRRVPRSRLLRKPPDLG